MTLRRILKTRTGIEKEIENFLNQVSQSGLIFNQGITTFFESNGDKFERLLQQMIDTEHRADRLRRSIEDHLYRKTLIPESRGDVLRMIETMDSLLGKFKGAMYQLYIEKPAIPQSLAAGVKSLSDNVVNSVEALTLSVRAYFTDINKVADHLHKVSFWEKEADVVSTQLQLEIFNNEQFELSQKMQLRDIIRRIEDISNQAEDVADSLSIYVIKRSL
ncbi:DUF47 domain-containing protein [Desulforhopalus singaporensis]|uniref:TIGR00153 family protein n=1 Tax=Desulforhopalus singaporensis TaxID=91360 RepID=A0A1H0RVL4_9BACT|nr:DUF47 family protein [Desulforhopalus singaporensis]SDP33612.1 hypothetical protein SAMN05660330_02448 [Desulforhopalus singaporensis]